MLKRNVIGGNLLYLFLVILFPSCLLSSSPRPLLALSAHEALGDSVLSLQLVGVIISEIPGSSVAVLKDEISGEMKILKEGETFSGIKIVRIYRNRILLEKEKQTFQLFIGSKRVSQIQEKTEKRPVDRPYESQESTETPAGESKSIKTMEFSRSEIERRIKEEMPILLSEARILPNLVDGEMQGFRISRLPAKSILSKLGIRVNDIIKEINGTQINSIETMLSFYTALSNSNEFNLVLQRNGRLVHLHYVLKDGP